MLINQLEKIHLLSMPAAAAAADDQDEPTNDQPLIQPEIQTTSESSTTIRYGTFKLTRDQWQQLGKAIQTNGGRITRAIIPAGLFINITTKYPNILNEFTRLGWIDDNQELTSSGREWFSRFIPPPADQGNQRPAERSTPTTTRATTAGDDTAAAVEEWLNRENQRRRGNHE